MRAAPRHRTEHFDRRRRNRRRPAPSLQRTRPPTRFYGGSPAEFTKSRFDGEPKGLLLRRRWRDLPPAKIVEALPLLCGVGLEVVKDRIRKNLEF